MEYMTVPQAVRWINEMEREFGGKFGRNGLYPELRKAGKYIRTEHAKRMKQHVTADGTPWAKTGKPRDLQVGESGPIRTESGRPYFTKIKTVWQLSRVTRNLKRLKWMPHPNGRGQFKALIKHGSNALYRTSKPRAKDLYNFLKSDRVAIGKGGSMISGSVRMKSGNGEHYLRYGFSKPVAWAADLQEGGKYGNERYPGRRFIGLNSKDITAIEKIFADGLEKRIQKRNGSYSAVA